MRNCTVGTVLVGLVGLAGLLGSAACQAPAEVTEVQTQEVIGGNAFVTGLESVCSMLITPPLDDDGNQDDAFFCSCTKIAPSIVLTAASCVEPNLTEDKLADIDIRFGTSFDGGVPYTATEVVLQRYYDRDSSAVDNLAMIRLNQDPPEAAAILNVRTLTSADVGPAATAADCLGAAGRADINDLPAGCAALVGFGETADQLDDHGAKNLIAVPIRSVDRRTLAAGTEEVTTCNGDTGGPMFVDLEDGLVLVAVTSGQSTCSAGVVRTRISPHLETFIFPYIDSFGATCGLDGSVCEATGCPRTPDPDCDDCSWNGVCEENCPTRDWDCELGVNPGLACTQSGQCEDGGRCIEAGDDASFTYCSQPCDPADDFCAGGMVCSTDTDGEGTNECTWPLPSPGSQGASCSTTLDCRSGICEELICVTECDPGAADPCPTNHANPDQPFTCASSTVEPGKNVCLGVIFSGGGGFCTVDAADPASPVHGENGRGLLVLFGAVGLALVVRSRRRRS